VASLELEPLLVGSATSTAVTVVLDDRDTDSAHRHDRDSDRHCSFFTKIAAIKILSTFHCQMFSTATDRHITPHTSQKSVQKHHNRLPTQSPLNRQTWRFLLPHYQSKCQKTRLLAINVSIPNLTVSLLKQFRTPQLRIQSCCCCPSDVV